ncbi:hypothetical protein KP509_33G032800 [Ceratopteris richardii]|uniref:non-specific serine/threonine protein kinase n=1 Tax=Ceratopteris richardii TaxID=49495 RepID=A0A8T2QNK2_CERRI|nr:hypothetical protein KP509_33G032800 [Ceratopteris richardii]
MWRLKQFMPKDQFSLEGKTMDVGALRLQIRGTIAEGGFSRVYLARDAQSGKPIALKHIICGDSESLNLVKKEVSALKVLSGHPNIITLEAQSMYDTNGTKECFLAMEYCEKSLVAVLDNRGAGFYEERQLLLMFRDVCNAICAMHSQSPPMAHRDIKAENVLLGSDGIWKLCDFGSVSTNHRRFEQAADMGLEEDIIRKHTTPAYRAPEMWDLYRREIISEKVDIWALGCLLYRMAYLKNAFDGESKLQILNGNYRLPDLPNYSSVITGLIKETLQLSPEKRPTAMQLWQRVNSALPSDYQNKSPDISHVLSAVNQNSGNMVRGRQPSVQPTRAPPQPPHKGSGGITYSMQKEPHKESGKGGDSGSFWSRQYAQDSSHDDDSRGALKETLVTESMKNSSQGTQTTSVLIESLSAEVKIPNKKVVSTNTYHTNICDSKPKWDEENYTDFDDQDRASVNAISLPKGPQVGKIPSSSSDIFSEFVADFENASIFNQVGKDARQGSCQAECEGLRAELKKVQKQVSEFSLKCEKLTSICESQRVEIQHLKSALTKVTSHSTSAENKERTSKSQTLSSSSLQKNVKTDTIWDKDESTPHVEFSVTGWQTREVHKANASVRHYGDQGEPQHHSKPPRSTFSTNFERSNVTKGASEGLGSGPAVEDMNKSKGESGSSGQSKPAGWSVF